MMRVNIGHGVGSIIVQQLIINAAKDKVVHIIFTMSIIKYIKEYKEMIFMGHHIVAHILKAYTVIFQQTII